MDKKRNSLRSLYFDISCETAEIMKNISSYFIKSTESNTKRIRRVEKWMIGITIVVILMIVVIIIHYV